MGLVLRSGVVFAGEAVRDMIGPFPVKRPPGRAPSWEHARLVWQAVAADVGRQRVDVNGQGVVPMMFATVLAGHVVQCGRCRSTGALDDTAPEEWLRKGIRRVPALHQVVRRLRAVTPAAPSND